MRPQSPQRNMKRIGILVMLIAAVWFGFMLMSIGASMGGAPGSDSNPGPNPMVPLVVFCFGVVIVIGSFFQRAKQSPK